MSIRLYIYAAIALALGGLLWHDHYQTHKANRLARETNELRANYAALEAAHAHERKIAEDASHEFQRTVTALQAARADTPVRTVRLCHGPANSVPAAADAASGAYAAGAGGLPDATGQHPRDRWGDDGPDIGPALYDEADRADLCPAQLTALQEWVRSR